ncbi:hypothetical protein, partial [Salmonella sp. SAL4435]|uniref:hypothetical protein n=1 Tax=Salmonella sp. SAL4435 TaxID=3159890 RepID=UPI00397836BC
LKVIRGEVDRVAFFSTSGSTDTARLIPTMERLAGCKALAALGLTEAELKDPAVYESRLKDFQGMLRTAPKPRIRFGAGLFEHA